MSAAVEQNVLVLHSAHSAVNGVTSFVDSLVTMLPEVGWTPTVGLSWGRRFHQPSAFAERFPSWNTVWLDGRTGTVAGRHLAIQRAIQSMRASIVLVNLLDDGLRAAIAMKQAGFPVRLGVVNHGNSPQHLAAIAEVAEYLDLAATVNEASAAVLQELARGRWHESAVRCIPIAAPPPTHPHVPRSDDRLRIGFVGRLSIDKGVEQLPEIVARLEERGVPFELTIAGHGPDQPLVDSLAAKHPRSVRYVGGVSRETLYREVYPQLDVVLCCSPSEGWPIALAEAMSHGAACVSSEFLGIHVERILRHNETALLFPIGDVDAAADHLASLAADPHRLTVLQSAAAAEILNNFSLQKFAGRWAETLSDVCSRPPRGVGRSTWSGRCRNAILGCKEFVRRRIDHHVPHESVRAEWPSFWPQSPDGIDEAAVVLARQLGSPDAVALLAGKPLVR